MANENLNANGYQGGGQAESESTHYFGNHGQENNVYSNGQSSGYNNGNNQYGNGYPPQYPSQGGYSPYGYSQPPAKGFNGMKFVWIGIIAALLAVIAFLLVKLLSNKDTAQPTPAPAPVEKPVTPTPETPKPETPKQPEVDKTVVVEHVVVEEPVALGGNWTFSGKLHNGNGGTDDIEISLDSDSQGNCSGYFNNYSYGLWIDLSGKLTANSFNVSGYDTSTGNFWTVSCKRGSGRNYSGYIKSSAKMRLTLTANR